VLELLQHVLGHSQRQPGLADARRPDQGDQPGAVGEQPFAHRGDILLAADERGELGGEVVGALGPQQARAGRKVVVEAARQGDQAGQVCIVHVERSGQGCDQRRGRLQVAAFDLAQRNLGAASPLRQGFLCQAQRLAPLFEPLAETAFVSHA
jgi:hypothetical protein